MLKNDKKDLVKEIGQQISGKSVVFVDYEGIDVPSLDEVRTAIRKNDARLKIVKNTLLRRVLNESGNEALVKVLPEDTFVGMTAIAFMEEEAFASSGKIVLKAEKDETMKIKGALHEGRVLNANDVRILASIPSKEELYSILVGVLQSVIGKLVVVLDEVGKKRKSNT